MAEMQTSNESQPAKKFQLVGGELCLDFCNTVGGKRGVVARENLHSYAHFLSWCEQAGLVDANQAAALVAKAVKQPEEAQAVLARAIALREAIYRIFLAAAECKTPLASDLEQLNSELAGSLCRLRVAPAECGFDWQWASGNGALDQTLGPIARSAAELLTSAHLLSHVRQCGGDRCGWLFLDASKNHSRRWCDMRDCGNRAKVRRFREKHQ